MISLKTNPFAAAEPLATAGAAAAASKEVTPNKAAEATAAAAAKAAAPVFRHGDAAAKLCDMALTVTGPSDPRLLSMIRSDDDAQLAFHMQKALEMAIDNYKRSRQAPWAVSNNTPINVWSSPQAPLVEQRPMVSPAQPFRSVPFGDGGRWDNNGGGGGGGGAGGGGNWNDRGQQQRSWRPASGRVTSGGNWKGGNKRIRGSEGNIPRKMKRMG